MHYLLLFISWERNNEMAPVSTKISIQFKIDKTDEHKKMVKKTKSSHVKRSQKKKVLKPHQEKRVAHFDSFFKITPKYPYLSRIHGEQGESVYEVSFDSEKKIVSQIKVIKSSGYFRLDEAGQKAIEEARLLAKNDEIPETLKAVINFQILED